MTLNFFGSLANFFGGRSRMSAEYRKDLMTWAKTEYPKDWEFAYNHMLTHDGEAPTHAHISGIVL